MGRPQLIAFVLVAGLVVFGVVWQFVDGQSGQAAGAGAARLEVGEALDPDVVLADLDGRRHRLGDRLGEKATVLYAWSTTCSCIPICDPFLAEVRSRWGEDEGVRWLAVAGEPADSPVRIRETLEERPSAYGFLRDPAHRLCGPLGFDRSSLVAVLDGDGVLRFRGSPIDSLREPRADYLAEALPRVVAGSPLEEADREPAFGCPFAAPLADCPDT